MNEPMHIFFVRGKGLVARLVNWQTWGDGITHCGILTDDGVVIHSTLGKGVEETTLETVARPGERIEVFTVLLSELQAEHLVRAARSHVGAAYDILGNIGFILRRRVERRSKWFCSELVAWAFQQIGLPLLERIHWWQGSPADLYRSPLLRHRDDWVPSHTTRPYLKWVLPRSPENARKRPSGAFSENPPTDMGDTPRAKMQHHATRFSDVPKPSTESQNEMEPQNG